MSKKQTKKNSKFVINPLVVVLGILLCGLLFIWYNKTTKPITKEFISERVGLSFSYPSYFPLSQPTQEGIDNDTEEPKRVEVIRFGQVYYPNTPGFGLVQVFKDTSTLEAYKADLLKPKEIYVGRSGRNEKVPAPEVKEVNIGNNLKALKIMEKDKGISSLNNLSDEHYVFLKNGFRYDVKFYYKNNYPDLSYDQYERASNMILSTINTE